jgi:hypothetical protein
MASWKHVFQYWSPQDPQLPSGRLHNDRLHIFVKVPDAGE